MDLVRSCYKAKMRLYLDRPEILVPGRWHFCPPGAVPVPFFHLYGSANWDPDERRDPLIGEVGSLPRTWSNGSADERLIGQNVCGNARVWEVGSFYEERESLLVNEQGLPLCCRLAPIPDVGLAAGGDAIFIAGRHLIGDGGLSADGEAAIAGPVHLVGDGGLSADGEAAIAGPYHITGDGGMGADGEAEIEASRHLIGDGGLSADGEAAIQAPYYVLGDGGLSADGEAAIQAPYYVLGDGGLSADGEAAIAGPVHLVGDGGLSADGEAEISGGGAGIPTACCPAPIPITLAFVSGLGGAGTLLYDPPNDWWIGDNGALEVKLFCTSALTPFWDMTGTRLSDTQTVAGVVTASTCDPFFQEFIVTFLNPPPNPPDAWDVTITP